MSRLELFDVLVERLEQGTSLPRVGSGEFRRDDSNTYAGIRHEQMTVYRLVSSAACTHQGSHSFLQDRTHADGIHFQKLREDVCYFTLHVLSVPGHLPLHMLPGQQRVKSSIVRGVNIRRQMFRKIIYGIIHQILVNPIEHITDDPFLFRQVSLRSKESVHKLITNRDHVFHIVSLKENKCFIFDAQRRECQLDTPVFVARRGHQFIQILFKINLRREIT